MKHADLTLLIGGLLGMTAVIMAAVGSHVAAPSGTAGVNPSWQAASQLHFVHSLALLVLSALMKHEPRPLLFAAALAIATGVLLFSGAIYLSQMAEWPAATRVTPLGGLLLIFGWLLIMLSPLRRVSEK